MSFRFYFYVKLFANWRYISHDSFNNHFQLNACNWYIQTNDFSYFRFYFKFYLTCEIWFRKTFHIFTNNSVLFLCTKRIFVQTQHNLRFCYFITNLWKKKNERTWDTMKIVASGILYLLHKIMNRHTDMKVLLRSLKMLCSPLWVRIKWMKHP